MFNQSRDGENNRRDKGKRTIGHPSNLGLDEQSRDGGNNRRDKGKRTIGHPSNLGLDEQSDRVKYQAILSPARRKQGEHFRGIRSDDCEVQFSNITSNPKVVTPTTRPIVSTLRWGPTKNYALEMAIEDMIERQLDDLPDVEDIREPIENAHRIKMRHNVPCDQRKVFSTENVEEFKAYASDRLPKWKNEDGDGHRGGEGEPPQPWNNGGPSINELLLSFDSHVAHNLWFGLDRGVLTCYSRANQICAWSLNSPAVINLLHETGLFHLNDCMYKHLNAPLISAFVERWQPETNSFHLPFGEMTVTLHDVWYILRVPVTGKPFIEDNLTVEYVGTLKCQLAALLGVDMSEVHKEWTNGSVHVDFIHENLKDSRNFPDFIARGYLLWLLGATLFVDKTGNRCHGHFLPYVVNLEEVNNHAWGAATLAYLCRQLGMASRADTTQISSCLTLLQAWIYEYFPVFRPTKRQGWTDNMPYACKWQQDSTSKQLEALVQYKRYLDRMTPDMVCWTPFQKFPHLNIRISLFTGIIHCRTITEPYMPNRVMRQFGYIQVIPPDPIQPIKVCRERRISQYKCDHNVGRAQWVGWMYYIMSLKDVSSKARFAAEVSNDYMDWFLPRTHPQVFPPTNGEDDMQPKVPYRLMTPAARLQFIANHLYPLHPRVRHLLDDETFYYHLDVVCHHLEDYMPFMDKGQ